jgi:hypothetical protein
MGRKTTKKATTKARPKRNTVGLIVQIATIIGVLAGIVFGIHNWNDENVPNISDIAFGNISGNENIQANIDGDGIIITGNDNSLTIDNSQSFFLKTRSTQCLTPMIL